MNINVLYKQRNMALHEYNQIFNKNILITNQPSSKNYVQSSYYKNIAIKQ
jgi:hypothetical protein